MKRILSHTALFIATLFLCMSCSNILTQIYNTTDIQKTGNDHVDTTRGLVVLKATDTESNQIASFDEDTFEYDLSTIVFESADDSVQLRCFAQDEWAHIEWTAVQTHSTEQVNTSSSATYDELATPVNVRIVPGTDTQYATVILPYGKTLVTAKIVADDPLYGTEYSVVIAKPNVYSNSTGTGTVAQLRDLSFTPIAIDEEGYDPEIEIFTPNWNADATTRQFNRQQNNYTSTSTWYWVNEDVGDIQVNLDIPDGVTLESITYGTSAEGVVHTVAERQTYRLESMGGEHPLNITTKDSADIERTYSVTIKRTPNTDTSLREFGYTITGQTKSGSSTNVKMKAESGSPIGTAVTGCAYEYKLLDDSDKGIIQDKDYGVALLSADYVYDITELTYYVTSFHRRAHVNWAIVNSSTAVSDIASWTEYNRTTGIRFDCTTNDTTETTFSKKLWIKITAEDPSRVNYYSVTLTKPNAGNNVIETLYAFATNSYQGTATKRVCEKGEANGTGENLGKAANFTTSSLLLDESDGVDAYTDSLTFYLRMANKNTPVTYTVTDINGTTVTSGTASAVTYSGNKYASFTISDLNDSRYNGDSRITITRGTTNTVFTLRKPDNTITDLRSLTLASSTDVKSKQLSNLTQALTIDLKATTNTNIIELNAVTKSKTATITASAISTQVPNNYLPGDSIPVTVVQNATYPTDWTITLGDADTPIPQGKVTLTITVSNTGTASDKTYNIAITKDEDSESRLESLVITNADGTATIWNPAFDKDTYRTFEYKNSSGSYIPGNYPQGTRATYSVSHTSKTGKPSISVQTMQTGAKIEIFYYQSGSYSTIASGTTSLTYDLLESTESIAYQIRITSKDTSIRRQYNITLSYEGADLSQIGDASVSDGTYTYTSENVSAPSPIAFSVTSLSENISIAVSGENSEGTALTFNPVEQDPSDSKQWHISAPAGNELTMGTNEITLDVTNTITGLTQTYTYKLLYETAVLTHIDDIAETIDGVYEYNSTDITQGFATGWEFYITSSSEDVSISVSGQNSEGTALTLSTPTRDATNPKRWKISAPTGNGFTIGTNPIVITVTNTNSSDVKTYTYNIIRTQ